MEILDFFDLIGNNLNSFDISTNVNTLHLNIKKTSRMATFTITDDTGKQIASFKESIQSIPLAEIKDLYNNILGDKLTNIIDIKNRRRAALSGRWNDNVKYQTLEFWRDYFTKVSELKFLIGAEPLPAYKKPTKEWKCDFDWLINANNFKKVLEGKYNNERFDWKYGDQKSSSDLFIRKEDDDPIQQMLRKQLAIVQNKGKQK